MAVFGHARLWSDVFDERLDSEDLQAPELGYLVSRDEATRLYWDSGEFFSRTLVTERVLELLRGLVGALRGEGRRVYALYSFFGGGKTHTLFTVYHAVRSPGDLLGAVERSAETLPPDKAVALRRLGEEVARGLESLGGVEVVLVSGKYDSLFPGPSKPVSVDGVTVRTLWGYIAARLGRYSVVEGDDRSVRVPGVDTLREVFRGVRALILVDEVLEGVKSYAESGSEDDRRYASQLVSFIDNMLSAVSSASDSQVAVVVTIPGERGEAGSRLEGRYEAETVRRLAESLLRAIERAGPVPVEPVASSEFWRVVKRRLFEWVDQDYARVLSMELRSVYEDWKGLFGEDASRIAREVEYTYPLHPLFAETLRDIVERNRALQKTRSALRIARIVARSLYERHERGELVEDMIMPWHIDPVDSRIARIILSGYENYAAIVDKDLKSAIERAFQGGRKELARITAVSVFISTYTLGLEALGQAVKQYPTRQQVALMVYEPGIFQARGWFPNDIQEVLDELPKNLYHMWTDGEKYWFWYLANVNEVIERRARELVTTQAPKLLEEITIDKNKQYLKGLIEKRLNPRPSPSRKNLFSGTYRSKLFKPDDVKTYVRVGPGDVPDEPRYRLVIAWEPREASFKDIVIYTVKSGQLARRRFANTIVVLTVSRSEMRDAVISEYARIKAAEQALGEVKKLYEDVKLPPQVRNVIINIQRNIIDSIIDYAYDRLLALLLNSFDTVYYPTRSDVTAPPTADEATVPFGVSVTNLVEKVESILKDKYAAGTGGYLGVGKVVLSPNEISLDYFLEILKLIVPGIEREFRRVDEIIVEFKVDPLAPMVPDEVLVEIISNAVVKGMLIARTPEGSIVYPRIAEATGRDCREPSAPAGFKIGMDHQVILASTVEGVRSLLEYLESLSGQEELPDGRVRVRYVEVFYEGDRLGLEEFKEAALVEPSIVEGALFCIREEVRERGVKLSPERRAVKSRVGEESVIRVRVEPIGVEPEGEARLEVQAPEEVSVEPREAIVRVGGEALLRVRAGKPGEYTLTLRVSTAAGSSDEATLTLSVEGLEKILDCSEAASLGGDAELLWVEVRGPWRSVEIGMEYLVSRLGPGARAVEAVLVEEESGVELRLSKPQPADAALELVKGTALTIDTLIRREPRVAFKVEAGSDVKVEDVRDAIEQLVVAPGQGVSCRAAVKLRR